MTFPSTPKHGQVVGRIIKLETPDGQVAVAAVIAVGQPEGEPVEFTLLGPEIGAVARLLQKAVEAYPTQTIPEGETTTQTMTVTAEDALRRAKKARLN